MGLLDKLADRTGQDPNAGKKKLKKIVKTAKPGWFTNSVNEEK